MGFAAPSLGPAPADIDSDDVVFLRDASWADFERVLAIRGERSSPRISYLDGTIEIMAPSKKHEGIKSLVGCLVEVWCLENDVPFGTFGGWTLKKRPKKAGVEPDECYVFGDPRTIERAARPDLAIEVVWTSGRIDKLEIYRRLRVREVWWWEDGMLQPYVLHGERYRKARASKVLKGIDLAQLVSFLDRTTYEAIRAYRAALRAR
jgi:Uma2 family endonuclease